MSSITKNQRQIKLFIASAIIIAFLVSAVSSIVVQELYSSGNMVFPISLVAVLLLTILVSYELIASEGMRRSIDAEFIFTFDCEAEKFLDIACHSPSVHSRVAWDSLTPEHKKHLVTLNNWRDFFNSDVSKFTDGVILYYIIMIIIRNTGWRKDGYKEFRLSDLPNFIRSNVRISSDKIIGSDDGPAFYTPRTVSIQRLEEDELFIEANSKYGSLTIKWSYCIGQGAYRTKPFLISEMGKNTDSCNDVMIQIECSSKIKHWRMLGEGAREYSEWVEGIFKNIEDSSWSTSEKRLELYLLSQLFIK